MIIQSARLLTKLVLARLVKHVFRGKANDAIRLLHGDADDLAMMQQDAGAAGKRYAIRHFKISPAERVTLDEMAAVMRDIAKEFGFALSCCVLVEHTKPRVGGGYERHWHLLVPEWDPVRRRVLDAHWMRPRQEKLARLAELRLGHASVVGRWNMAAARAVKAAGDDAGATAIAKLAEVPRPCSAYSAGRHQAAARQGAKLPELKALVAHAWAHSDDTAGFTAALSQSGMHVRAGDKAGIWVVERQDDATQVLLGALHRLVCQPKQTRCRADADHGGRAGERRRNNSLHPTGTSRAARRRWWSDQ